MGWSDATGATPSRAGLFAAAGEVRFFEVNTAGADTTVIDSFTVGTGWHIAVCERKGTKLRLTIDGRPTKQNDAVAGTLTVDKLTIGTVRQSGNPIAYAESGASRGLGRLTRALERRERNKLIEFARANWLTA